MCTLLLVHATVNMQHALLVHATVNMQHALHGHVVMVCARSSTAVFGPGRVHQAAGHAVRAHSTPCGWVFRSSHLQEEFTELSGRTLSAAASGGLAVTISATYPLAEAARAHADLQGRATAGKLLLLPPT